MARQFDFSPDGERIVFAGTNLISLWERNTSITRRLELRSMGDWKIAGDRGAIAMPRWAPDSRKFAFQAVRKLSGTWDAPVLAYALILVNSDTGEARQIGADLSQAEQAADLCWRPDGQAITFVFQQRSLVTLSLSGERIGWKDSGLPATGHVRLGDYSADGAWLLISSDSGTAEGREERDIWAVPHLGGPGERLTQSAGLDAYPTWGPDGEAVYFISAGGRKRSETWGAWRVPVDPETMRPKGPANERVSGGPRGRNSLAQPARAGYPNAKKIFCFVVCGFPSPGGLG